MITCGSVTAPAIRRISTRGGFFRFLSCGAKWFSPPLCIGVVTLGNGRFAKRMTHRGAAALVLAAARARRRDNGREFVMRAPEDSGPGRTPGAEHQIHGLAAHLAGDRGDLVLTGSRRLASATAARCGGSPVPGDAENRWHALAENCHLGPAAAHAVRGTPDAPAGGNDHRNELGAHIETARLALGGDGVHREPGHRACLVPVLRGRKAERHGPGRAGRCLPGSGRMRRAPVR
jgi:hypothetical protein